MRLIKGCNFAIFKLSAPSPSIILINPPWGWIDSHSVLLLEKRPFLILHFKQFFSSFSKICGSNARNRNAMRFTAFLNHIEKVNFAEVIKHYFNFCHLYFLTYSKQDNEIYGKLWFAVAAQQTFTCSKFTIETQEKSVTYVQI